MGVTSRFFNTGLFEHKCDLKLINRAKLKVDELNKKGFKHCFKYEYQIEFINFEILNFNIDLGKNF